MSPLDSFIETLACYNEAGVFNPWRDTDPLDLARYETSTLWPWMGWAGRRARLKNHLQRDADFMLIGEAPGYQGCHFSGVPFTSEVLVMNNQIPGIVTGGERLTSRERPFAEPSATIVWAALRSLGIHERTVLWNAFPWHPHEEGELLTNRTPTAEELHWSSAGALALHAMVDMFPYTHIVAVGRKAEELLTACRIKADACIRHPANGGATKFRDGLSAFVNSVA